MYQLSLGLAWQSHHSSNSAPNESSGIGRLLCVLAKSLCDSAKSSKAHWSPSHWPKLSCKTMMFGAHHRHLGLPWLVLKVKKPHQKCLTIASDGRDLSLPFQVWLPIIGISQGGGSYSMLPNGPTMDLYGHVKSFFSICSNKGKHHWYLLSV